MVCARRALLQRYRDDKPPDVCIARGTSNSHPCVMGAKQVFLECIQTREVQAFFADLEAPWNRRAARMNQRLTGLGLPAQVAMLSSIWRVCCTQPSRHNSMLQYYLREAGLALSCVGTGSLIFSLSCSAADCEAVRQRFVSSCRAILNDGWWWAPAGLTRRATAP